MKLWTDRFKDHKPFPIARRNHIQNKWDLRCSKTLRGNNKVGDSNPRVIGYALNTKSQNQMEKAGQNG